MSADKKVYVFNILIIFGLCLLLPENVTAEVRGHQEKLGAHRAPQGISMIGKFSAPPVFFGHFVKPGKPIWMKGVLSGDSYAHPGLTNWTDAFLRKQFGSEMVKFEVGKKETREGSPQWLSLRQFLSIYKSDDVYMVHSLTGKMQEMVLIPSTLQCGGFQRIIQEAVMWLGSGKAMSVLHYDELDNLLCLLDGRKDLLLIDKSYKDDIEDVGFNQAGAYSTVDVEKVNLKKFPRLANTIWHEIRLSKGDCAFIPKGWYHQVTSSGDRHLAVNLWFSHLHWFDSANCSKDKEYYKPLEPISSFGFASPNEAYRAKLLEKLQELEFVTKDLFVDTVDISTPQRRRQFFEAVNKYKDVVLAWNELYGFDIDKAIMKFPDIFGLPGNPIDNSEEEIILYDPVATIDTDDTLDDGEDDVASATCRNGYNRNSDSCDDTDGDSRAKYLPTKLDDLDIDSFSNEVDSSPASLPLPDDVMAESSQTEEDVTPSDTSDFDSTSNEDSNGQESEKDTMSHKRKIEL